MSKLTTPTVMLPLSHDQPIVLEAVAKLEAALAAAPDLLNLEIIGAETLVPDLALVCHEVLTARQPGTRIVTKARSSLVDSAVLPWLLGDEREIRRTGWISVRLPRSFRRAGKDRSAVYEDTPPWLHEEFEWLLPSRHYTADYEWVLKIVDDYLPVDEIGGKRLTEHDLNAYGLLRGNPIDRMLASCMEVQSLDATASTGGAFSPNRLFRK